MKPELTPEEVMEMGKMWGDAYLSSLSPEELLKDLKPEDRLRGLSVKEIEAYLRKFKKQK